MKIVRNEIFKHIKIRRIDEADRHIEYRLSRRDRAILVRLDKALLTASNFRSFMLKNEFRMAAKLLNEHILAERKRVRG